MIKAFSSTGIRRLVTLAVIALLVAATGCEEPPPAVGTRVGQTCPEFAGGDVDGKTIRLSDYRGKVIFVNFWAPWCAPCRALIPHERQMFEVKYKNRPFTILGVTADSPENVKEFFKTTPLPWPNIVDGRSGPLTKMWNVESFPSALVIDHKGVIRGKWFVGMSPDEVQKVIDKAVQAAERE